MWKRLVNIAEMLVNRYWKAMIVIATIITVTLGVTYDLRWLVGTAMIVVLNIEGSLLTRKQGKSFRLALLIWLTFSLLMVLVAGLTMHFFSK